MKTIKYLLIILFCSCATLLYSQVESTYPETPSPWLPKAHSDS